MMRMGMRMMMMTVTTTMTLMMIVVVMAMVMVVMMVVMMLMVPRVRLQMGAKSMCVLLGGYVSNYVRSCLRGYMRCYVHGYLRGGARGAVRGSVWGYFWTACALLVCCGMPVSSFGRHAGSVRVACAQMKDLSRLCADHVWGYVRSISGLRAHYRYASVLVWMVGWLRFGCRVSKCRICPGYVRIMCGVMGGSISGLRSHYRYARALVWTAGGFSLSGMCPNAGSVLVMCGSCVGLCAGPFLYYVWVTRNHSGSKRLKQR